MSDAMFEQEGRRSRQDLVVPPPQSRFPVAAGAVACGCLGFALVWVLGIGRQPIPPAAGDATDQADRDGSAAAHDTAADPAPAAADQPLSDAREPQLFQGADASEMRPARSDRWRPRGVADEPVAESVQPTSLEATDLALQAAAEPRRFSRFSSADLPPVDEPPAAEAATTEATADAPPDQTTDASRSEPERNLVAPVSSSEPEAEPASPSAPIADAAADAPPDAAVDLQLLPDTAAPPADEPAAPVALPEPELLTDPVAPSSDAPTDGAADAVAPAAEPPATAPAPTPEPQATAAPPAAGTAAPPQAVSPPVNPPAVAPFAAAPAIAPPPAAAPAPRFAPSAAPQLVPPLAAPLAPARPVAAVASPFASAPAIVPGTDAGPQASFGAQSQPQQAPAGVDGQGRPGPLQLEGVQSPQLAVEKRGPREIQVGKPARYEVLVRNVGSATANDVVLRDAIPFGTTLITTTPPASPANAAGGSTAGDLVWSLGQLPPGGQARVVIELMPQAEGEIGSVASVSFRADASVRSRATKPAVAIACSEPQPTLIGRDAGITITVSNPGTGIATGVVLEGFLPENVSHRSGRELEFDIGQLKPGEARTIELVLGTRGPGVHQARFAVRADGGLVTEQGVKLEVTAPTLELAIDMPLRRFLQRSATCKIAMVNAGTATARSIELAAQLPPGVRFVRANNAGWHDERTHRVLWNLEELPPGETGSVEVVVMPVELGPQKIVAAARSADGLADQVTHVCEVEGLAALFFEVTDSEDPIEVDGVTEYVVRVGNQGTKPATGVRLAATLLGDLEPVEARGPSGHRVDNLTVSFEPLAKLAPAEEAIFRVRAKGRTAGDQRVQVQLTSEDHPAPITKEEVTRVYDDR
ncbi:MAG: DUF11 domain-containing protein [Pirellulales bacterium]